MKILAVDSCSSTATAAVLCGGVLAGEFVINNKKTHSVKLLPQIENMLQSVDMSYADFDYMACTVGPGSFTGQRIGCATVKALAHAANKPTVGVSSLKALAYNVPFFDGIICPIMDARRQQVYTASFRFENGEPVTLAADRAMALDALLSELHGNRVLFLGDGVPAFADIIKADGRLTPCFPPPQLIHLRGGSVAACAADEIKKGNITAYDKLMPTYLRLSQAERELKERGTDKNATT